MTKFQERLLARIELLKSSNPESTKHLYTKLDDPACATVYEALMQECKPGSEFAHAQGCRCPIIDNHYGAGYFGNAAVYGYVMNGECPIHGLGVTDA